MAKVKKKKILKVKKKKWIEIIAPKVFSEVSLGRTYVGEQKDALNKQMTINLMNLTRDPKKQSINVSFQTTKIVGEKVATVLVKYAMQPTAVRRMVRRSKERIDDSFVVRTKDRVKLRIKPILITRTNASKPVQSAVRKKARQAIANELAKLDFDQFVGAVLRREFQKKIADRVKKIFPVGITEIRMFQVLPEKKQALKEAVEEKPKEKAEA